MKKVNYAQGNSRRKNYERHKERLRQREDARLRKITEAQNK
jgi:hypothetical protein